jgi:3-oxoacyl-[acyl-carrier-protein] synthase III
LYVVVNTALLEHTHHTTAATIPLCLWDYEPRLKAGDRMIFAAFGGGFTWAGAFVTWGYDGAQ